MGTTVNDVVLADVRRRAAHLPPGRRRAARHPAGRRGARSRSTPDVAELEGSNKVSAMFVQLPCHARRPAGAPAAIHEGTKGAKEEHKALGADTLQNWAEHATPNVFAAAARLYTGMTAGRPAPPRGQPDHLQRARPGLPPLPGRQPRCSGCSPSGPVMDGMGLNITIMSYLGVLYWGLASDARAVPRLWDIAAAIPRRSDRADGGRRARRPSPSTCPIHLGPGMPPTAHWIRPPTASTPGRRRPVA